MKRLSKKIILRGLVAALFVGLAMSAHLRPTFALGVQLVQVNQKADPLKGIDIFTKDNGCSKNDILISKNIWTRIVNEKRSRGEAPTMELDRENATYCFIGDVSLTDSTLGSYSLRSSDTLKMFTITRPGITVNMNNRTVHLPAHQSPSLPSVIAFYNPRSDHLTVKNGKIEGDFSGTMNKKGGIQVGYNTVVNDQRISGVEFNFLQSPVVIYHSINVTVEQSNFHYYVSGITVFNSLVGTGTIDGINILGNNFYDGQLGAIHTWRTPNDITIGGNRIQVNGSHSITVAESFGRLRITDNEIFSSAGRKNLIYVLDSNEAFLEHNRLQSNGYYPELTGIRFVNTDEIGVWDNHFRSFHYGVDVRGTPPSAGMNFAENGFCNVDIPLAVNGTAVNAPQVPYWMAVSNTDLNDCGSW